MSIKIKGFIPYALASKAFYDWCGKAAKSDKTADVIAHYLASDPHATEWGSFGLTSPIDEGRPVHDLDGTARLLTYQFNERILPGAVRDEILAERVSSFIEKEGRAIGRKEYAVLKEEVEMDLLPKAFIRRNLVHVLVYPEHILFCTTSATKAETMLAHLMSLCNVRKVDMGVQQYETVGTAASLIGRVARAGTEYVEDGADEFQSCLQAGTSMTIKGEDKRTIRIKDRSVTEADIAALLANASYAVTELGMSLEYQGDEVVSYTMTGTMVFKGIKLSNITTADVKDAQDLKNDAHTTAWLLARTFKSMVANTIKAMNEGADDDAEAL